MWRRNKKPSLQSPPARECEHHWLDFPWYIHGNYDAPSKTQLTEIFEPYVCIHCKQRKDVLLLRQINSAQSFKEATDFYNDVLEEYEDHLEPRAIVEDKISDMQLVDRDYLKYYRMLHEIPDTKQTDKEDQTGG